MACDASNARTMAVREYHYVYPFAVCCPGLQGFLFQGAITKGNSAQIRLLRQNTEARNNAVHQFRL